eukprot:1850580-Pyramimonas_sp.AAC.1
MEKPAGIPGIGGAALKLMNEPGIAGIGGAALDAPGTDAVGAGSFLGFTGVMCDFLGFVGFWMFAFIFMCLGTFTVLGCSASSASSTSSASWQRASSLRSAGRCSCSASSSSSSSFSPAASSAA